MVAFAEKPAIIREPEHFRSEYGLTPAELRHIGATCTSSGISFSPQRITDLTTAACHGDPVAKQHLLTVTGQQLPHPYNVTEIEKWRKKRNEHLQRGILMVFNPQKQIELEQRGIGIAEELSACHEDGTVDPYWRIFFIDRKGKQVPYNNAFAKYLQVPEQQSTSYNWQAKEGIPFGILSLNLPNFYPPKM